jgi:imidazolonepropionase-like amidohydrolase
MNRLLVVAALPWAAAGAQDVRIEHVTVISAERAQPVRDTTVSIHEGRIAGTAAGTVIDGHGLFLVPGLIDSHVHLGEIPGMTDEQEAAHPDIARVARDQIPRSYLYSGFTTLIDLNSGPAPMARWKNHQTVPDTYWCGGAVLRDGYPMNFTPKPARYSLFPYMITDDTTSAIAAVAHMKRDGATCVKAFIERGFADDKNLPIPSLETLRALVRAAHAAGMPVLMHANGAWAQSVALDAGADIIAHGMWHWEPSMDTVLSAREQGILDRVVSTGTGYQPTIQVLYGESELFHPSFLTDAKLARVLPASLIAWYGTKEGQWFHDVLAEGGPQTQRQADSAWAPWFTRVNRATGYLVQHHARLLLGTDTPSAPTYGNPPGLNGWLEMRNLAEVGMTPAEIFRAATIENARALRLDKDVGTVEIGKRANLLLLREDPTQTIDAYQTIVKIVLGGRVLDPSELAAQ